MDATQYIASQQESSAKTYSGDAAGGDTTPDLRYMQTYYRIQSDGNGDNNHLVGDTWIAAVYVDGAPAGFTSVTLDPKTRKAEPYMSSPDKAVARYLETTYRDGGRFAELYRAPIGYFMFKDGMVTPLGDSSATYIKTTVSEQEFFDAVNRIVMKDVADAKTDDPLAAGGGGSTADGSAEAVMERRAVDGSESALMAVFVCLLIAIIPMLTLAWKRHHDGSVG
ncbi:hypothetical protein KIH79_12380 [Bifidobacterium sp. 82T10]|uniref:Uncharacterized protein n=2 Tax=Bifidobacterium miconis TaxID=2834435 RepID=A0ABS6WKG0_9BIFI|nr:hypothetical protein [Bifidobacterium miconis]